MDDLQSSWKGGGLTLLFLLRSVTVYLQGPPVFSGDRLLMSKLAYIKYEIYYYTPISFEYDLKDKLFHLGTVGLM